MGKLLLGIMGLLFMVTVPVFFSNQALKAQEPVKKLKDSSAVKKQNRLKEVNISGKTLIREFKESPLPIEIIDLKAVHGQSGNLIELLNRVPGVKLRGDGALGDPVNINLNGLNGKAIAVFKDGIPLSFYGHSFEPSLIPSNMLDRIEVYKGALPVSLGADALGGAINFVSRAPSVTTLEASYELGSFNTHRATVSAYLPFKKYKAYAGINAAYTYSDNNYKRDVGWISPGDNNLVFDNTVRSAFRNNILKAPVAELYLGIKHKSWADDLRFTILGSQFYKQLPQLPGIPSNGRNDVMTMHPFNNDRTFSQLLKHDKSFLSGKLRLGTVLGYSRIKTTFLDTSSLVYNRFGELQGDKGHPGEFFYGGNALRLKYNFYTLRFNAVYDVLPDHQVQLNHIYTRYDRIGTDPLGGMTRNGELDLYTVPAKYAKHISALGFCSRFLDEKLENLIAVKRYQMKTSGYSTIGRSGSEKTVRDSTAAWGWMEGISFRPASGWVIKASYEHSVRMPDDFEVFGDSYNVKSNFGIRPEKSHNYNVQFQYSAAAQQAGAFNLSANYFSRRTNGRIMLVRDIPYSYYTNRTVVTSEGIEMEVMYKPFKFLMLSGNGTYMDVKQDLGLEIKGDKPSRLADQPPILGNLQLRLMFDQLLQKKSRTEFYGYWNYMHRFNWIDGAEDLGLFKPYPKDYEPRNFWIPGDRRLGQQNYTAGFIHYMENPKCSISLQVNNLTQQKLFDNFYMERPGRAVSVKLRWELSTIK